MPPRKTNAPQRMVRVVAASIDTTIPRHVQLARRERPWSCFTATASGLDGPGKRVTLLTTVLPPDALCSVAKTRSATEEEQHLKGDMSFNNT